VTDEEPCDAQFYIAGVDIIRDGRKGKDRKDEDVTFRCSLGAGHQPDDIHSDGVTDWRTQ